MTERNPPYVLHNRGDHPAAEFRLLVSSLVATEGVAEADDLEVTENTTPDMSVNVGPGACFIIGNDTTQQGTYHCFNTGTTVNLTVAAADGTNPRKDLVVARVRDSEYAGATDAWALEIITGTPAASPTEPSEPNNTIVLALIDVPAGATSITNADITDRRQIARSRLHRRINDQKSTTLTDKSLSSVGVFARWGSQTVTIPNPGVPISVTAQVVGYMDTLSIAGRRIGYVRVGISFDNGVSYTNGPQVHSELDRASADIRNVPVSAQHERAGTPTAQIAVQAEVQQVNGTAGEINYRNGLLVVTVVERP